MPGFTFTPDCVVSRYGDIPRWVAERYGDLLQSFTEIEKLNILAAIGLWGEHCAEFGQYSLAEYMAQYCPVRDDSDAWDMLMEWNPRRPQEAMDLVIATAAQLRRGIWLGNDE